MSGTWEQFVDRIVMGKYRLLELASDGGEQADFVAAADESDEPVILTLVRTEPEQAAPALEEMRRASRLQHPGILRIIDTGEWTSGEDLFLCLASERAERTLAAEAANGIPNKELRPLAEDLLAALKYLHGEGFAYCNLEPATTLRAGGRWKLGDLSRLCPLSAETARRDVWAFGTLLQGLRQGSEPLPEPFAGMMRRSLDVVPERRPSLDELEALLAQPQRETRAPLGAIAPQRTPMPQEIAVPPRSSVAAPPPAQHLLRSRLAIVLLVAFLCLVALLVFWPRRARTTPPAAPASKAVQKKAEPPAAMLQKPSAMRRRRETAAPQSEEPAGTAVPARRVQSSSERPARQEGLTDYSSSSMDGRPTASGEAFDSDALTAAHDLYPLGTRLKVTNPANRRSVVVRVNDRGRFRSGHVIRLTRRAAEELGIGGAGPVRVIVEPVR